MLVLLAGLACSQDSTPPDPSEVDPRLLDLTYVCGRNFQIGNANSVAATVGFQVVGSGETGELVLPPAPAPSEASQTRLTTATAGDVRLIYSGSIIAAAQASGTSCPPPVPPPPQPQASVGEWTAPFAWPVVAVHLNLLPTGRVLAWGRVGQPQVWDPVTGTFEEIPSESHLFCAGHALLADGRVLVAGGHLSDDHGIPDANLFDPTSQTWTPTAPMERGRWYPTTTTLADGRVVVLGGRDQNGEQVPVPELWDDGHWSPLPGAARELPYYPRTFVAPNGLLFYAGELRQSAYLDPSAGGSWTPVASSLYGQRDYGSAVMYRPGKVLIVGGSDPPDGTPTNTAETIDLTTGTPAWRFTGSMGAARRQFNTTLLPDGRVVATGGTSATGFTDPAGAVHAAEVWDPGSGTWTAWASNAVTRVYHSTTLLLPDGRLLHAGSGDGGGLPRETSAELYSPPYLFAGARPAITEAPGSAGYGATFFVATPDAGVVTRVTLVRLPAVTHAFDQNQRFNELSFRRSAGGVTVTAPASGAIAPPGHYLLFLLDGEGVPSVATVVRIG